MSINIGMDRFAFRQFDDPDYAGGTKMEGFDKFEFTRRINELFQTQCEGNPDELVPGYAPFCKHLFVSNFTNARLNCIEITDENRHLLRSDYLSRTPEELPVLTRYFPLESLSPDNVPVAKYLDIILYSREQILNEYAARGSDDFNESQLQDGDWLIIGIKAQDTQVETPMQPITMMRNSLGKEYGGSGVPLDHAKYMESVNYWKDRAVIK